jgi:OmcA/MtrC family decaheme c-type cytochrome
MPDRTYTWVWTNQTSTSNFSIGFPGYMNNCATCHDSQARLNAVNAAPVTFALCLSCHDSWDGFAETKEGQPLAFHRSYTATTPSTTCATCHDGGTAPANVTGFHNGQKTERNGLIWNGADQSVVEGAKFAIAITGVTRAGTSYNITWTAQYNGVAVNPCNTDFNVGPVFMDVAASTTNGKSASNMQFIKAYGQGDDWVNANRPGNVSPGQPATSATLAMTGASANTTCSTNVATTVTPVDTFVTAGTKGTMALQGKPQLRFAAAAGTTGEFIQARAKSPTYNFVVPSADGAATAAAARRTIVDTAKCLDCHLGTLYQHGGNRVDNVDLCVTCHNPAANETNVRVDYGVTAAEAYDGKPGEAYDMRNMVHAIHSAGESGMPLVIYRSRGIYFFGNQASLDYAIANRHWPTTGGVTCIGAEGEVTYYKVYGSIAQGNKPSRNATTGACEFAPSTDGAWQIHTATIVDYPTALSRCDACHADGWKPATVDPTKGVAVTVDPGVAPFGNQLDDVLWGPTSASCMSCHQSGVQTTQFGLRIHSYGQGWVPTTFEDGRQTLIDAGSALPYP